MVIFVPPVLDRNVPVMRSTTNSPASWTGPRGTPTASTSGVEELEHLAEPADDGSDGLFGVGVAAGAHEREHCGASGVEGVVQAGDVVDQRARL